MSVTAIILAAGRSSRFEDGHKLLVEIAGVPLVRRVCKMVAASRVADIVLVVNDKMGAVAQAAGSGPWRVVENPDAGRGLSTSLRAGLDSISQTTDGALVALGDMPGISAELIDALLTAFEQTPESIVFPQGATGERGHPIIWPRSLFPELRSVTGDAGGKTIISAHSTRWQAVDWKNPEAFIDIDTRADVANFLNSQFHPQK